MADELSQLDELIESDVLEALGEKVTDADSSIEIDGITIDDLEPQPEENVSIEDPIENSIEELTSENIEENFEDTQETPIVSNDESLENMEETQTNNSTEKNINSSDLATLLSELLNNKTIEITIKIKD